LLDGLRAGDRRRTDLSRVGGGVRRYHEPANTQK
jgi:hypothetical protein